MSENIPEDRTDFLPQSKYPGRKPRNIDFSNPEIANWAEAVHEDRQLASELEDSLNQAAERNKDNPGFLKKLSGLAATLGLAIAVVGGAKFAAENSRLSESDQRSPEASALSPEEQQKRAVEGMEKQKTQEEAAAWHKKETAAEAEKQKETLEESPGKPETPQTVENQDSEGPDTTKIE